ncbi:MAG: hypothetical protein ACRDOH_19235 [Streptosporangiaceae bacterium]
MKPVWQAGGESRSVVMARGRRTLGSGKAASAAPDLVILDLGLPDVPGEMVACEVRAAAAVPVLMLTGVLPVRADQPGPRV